MADYSATDNPWEGGCSVPVLPPDVPVFDGAAIVVAQQSDAQTGVVISYRRGIFTRQSWSTGPPVPFLIEVLKPDAVREIRDQVAEQLLTPGTGLDNLPLRAFLAAADVHLNPEPSTRFNAAAFGAISEQVPGRFLGVVTYPNGVAGTLLGSDAEVSVESHLAPFPAGNLVPLRVGDLRSLIAALEAALAAGSTDPLWQQMLAFAQQPAA